MRLEPGSLYDYEARARQVLPHDYWDFIAGGSKDELTTQRNRSAFDAMSLRPRFLRDVTERKLVTTVLGTPISFPVMISPTGGHKLAHPEGECATARGAGMSNTLMMLSTSSHGYGPARLGQRPHVSVGTPGTPLSSASVRHDADGSGCTPRPHSSRWRMHHARRSLSRSAAYNHHTISGSGLCRTARQRAR